MARLAPVQVLEVQSLTLEVVSTTLFRSVDPPLVVVQIIVSHSSHILRSLSLVAMSKDVLRCLAMSSTSFD